MATKRKSTAQKRRAKSRHQRWSAPDRTRAAAPETARKPAERSRRPSRRPRARRSLWTWLAITAVPAIVVLMVILVALRGSGPQKKANASQTAIERATSVPAATLEKVGVVTGIGAIQGLPSDVPPVERGGKPVVTYVGAEYCPYCAAERWPMVVALSRFGSFSDLGTTTSSSTDVFPSTPTFSFHGSSYTSDYLVFSSVETQTNTGDPLDKPTAEQQRLLASYDTSGFTGGTDSAIPFVMLGNRFVWAGATFDQSVLKGLSFDEIARRLADPTDPVAKAIDGAANQITARICTLTGNRPGSVCSAAYVKQIQTSAST